MTPTNGTDEREPPQGMPPADIADRDDVERLVRDFYRQAAMDDLLGPVFAAAGLDWNEHIETVTAFWSWQALGVRGYTGHPLRAHEPAHARTPFTPAHFERWLDLFEDTVDSMYAGPMADLVKQRARKMAAAMRRLLPGVSDADGPDPVYTSS